MGATKLIGAIQEKSPDMSLRQEFFRGYEQRMSQWGCSGCGSFEKRVFKTELPFEELDAYFICRFAGELVDLIGEGAVCPKMLSYGHAA
jgi:rubredoxin